MDTDAKALIEQALAESDRVDPSRVKVAETENAIVLEGTVASPEERDAAELVAERHAEEVVNRLGVDPAVREGIEQEEPREEAEPAEGEILVGDTDPLAGAGTDVTTDSAEAFSENEPWDPPEEPLLPATEQEYEAPPAAGGEPGEEEPAPSAEDASPAAADLSEADLKGAREGAEPPYRAPEVAEPGVEAGAEPAPDPPGAGADPASDETGYPSRLPEATPGTGVMGEGTEGGGGVAGRPAPETGSKGADTAPSDPARSGTGRTTGGTGTKRGPEAQDDPPVREDLPSAEPDDG